MQNIMTEFGSPAVSRSSARKPTTFPVSAADGGDGREMGGEERFSLRASDAER